MARQEPGVVPTEAAEFNCARTRSRAAYDHLILSSRELNKLAWPNFGR